MEPIYNAVANFLQKRAVSCVLIVHIRGFCSTSQTFLGDGHGDAESGAPRAHGVRVFFDDEFPGIGLVVPALGIICDLRAETGVGVCGFKIVGAAIGMQ